SPGEFYLAHHCRAASPSLPEEKQVQLTEDGMLTTPTEKVGRCGAGNVEFERQVVIVHMPRLLHLRHL
uniref:Uncharacterized protein n=1 Tax=Triticum urartu TaxID=4572 RepID=A0A8R7V9Q3_TRIUA